MITVFGGLLTILFEFPIFLEFVFVCAVVSSEGLDLCLWKVGVVLKVGVVE